MKFSETTIKEKIALACYGLSLILIASFFLYMGISKDASKIIGCIFLVTGLGAGLWSQYTLDFIWTKKEVPIDIDQIRKNHKI